MAVAEMSVYDLRVGDAELPRALKLLREKGESLFEIVLLLRERLHRRKKASNLGAKGFDLVASGAHQIRIYDRSERAERDGRRSGMAGGASTQTCAAYAKARRTAFFRAGLNDLN